MFIFARGRPWAVAAVLVFAPFYVTHALAQGPVLAPPTLTSNEPAEDPREGPVTRVVVELMLEINRQGRVMDARVTRSGGDALDAAALASARRLTFAPATRDGQPVEARIRYESVFEARVNEPPPMPDAPTSASFAGSVVDAEGGKVLAGAKVVLTTVDGATHKTTTDGGGRFRLDGIPSGNVHVVVSADGHIVQQLDETLDSGMLTDVRVRLELVPDREAFGATARIEAPSREVTKRTLERKELASVAGTRGDPLRGVELMPGVSRPGANGGLPILRGANAFDSQVFMEGMPVPSLYHLGGLTSFVHSRVLDTVDLYPSNFSVRYGRKMGGVIEAKVRDPATDGLHGIADVSFLDSSLLVETPVTDKLSVLAAARRSNIDAVIHSVAGDSDFGIRAAPVYWDYQAIAAYKPTDQDRIRFLAYGSSDRWAIVFKNPASVDPSLRGNFDTNTTFHRAQLGYRHRFRGGSEHHTELTYGREDGVGQFGQLARFKVDVDSLQVRSEWISVIVPELRVTGGLDFLGNRFHGIYTGLPLPPGEGDAAAAASTQRKISVDTGAWSWFPGAYLEAGIRPFPALLVTPGIRADYNNTVNRGAIDPRLSSRLDVTESTVIKAGIGNFSQIPFEAEVMPPTGNPNLELPRALHVSAGIEHNFTPGLSASMEGFTKWMDRITTTTPDGRAPYFANTQRGRVFGGELLLRMRPVGRGYGFLSYTLMRSERGEAGEAFRLFDRDQTHILAATAVTRVGRGWELGATFRYTSGTPYSPVVASTYEATTDVYQPRLGSPMSARNPAFSRLDLRIQKSWTFSKWSLAVHLDVQNVFNAENREGFRYSYDYRRREGTPGLPILPVLGLRGEL